MRTVFIDAETSVTKTITLRRMTVRRYLSKARLLGIAVALDDEDPVWFSGDEIADLIPELERLAQDPMVRFVAHNWSFDGRVLALKLGLPYPTHARCTMEGAMCAFPDHPGGYDLDNLSATLRLPSGVKAGKAIEVGRMSPDELAEYCCQDVRLCRDLYRVLEARIHPYEWRIGESCSRAKEGLFTIDTEAVDRAVAEFDTIAESAAEMLEDILDDTGHTTCGREDNGRIKSIKPEAVKRLLLENLGFDTNTIGRKKINPVSLSGNAGARAAIDAASKANGALSSRRRVAVFSGTSEIDAELNWFAARTGRSASRTKGRGLNLLNLPKRNPDASRLIRSMFRLPDGLCFVRGDEANVEYRVAGLLSGSVHVRRLFEEDPFADPYSAFGEACTGKRITKADKIRHLFKSAVLGLGYGMGLWKWTGVILGELGMARPAFTIDDMRAVCESNAWSFPKERLASRVLRELGCDPVVVTVAHHTRRLFHEVHPEFGMLARWLFSACEETSAGAPQSVIDDMYQLPGAPDPVHVKLIVSDRFEGRSLELQLAEWPAPTLVWRDLGVRDAGEAGGACLTVMAGKKGYRPIRITHTIENVVQAASRNRTAMAKLALEDLGWPYIFDVHDELLPVVSAEPEQVLKARADMLSVLGPGRPGPWGWAVVIHPDEVNVSQSWYEVDVGKLDPRFPSSAEWWGALTSHPELLECLP